jgi:hypothetical protein
LIQTGGVALVLAALGDVYLTVLYARAGVGVFSQLLGPAIWRVFRAIANPFPAGEACDPVVLRADDPAAMVSTWLAMLIAGFALVVWPALGTGVQAVRNDTRPIFQRRFYFAGYS